MLPTITAAESLKKFQEGSARLVDVREADEIRVLRVPGAEVAPLSLIQWEKLAASTPEKPVIFFCNSGNRTNHASDALAKLAGGPALQMEGGIKAWKTAGLPLEGSGQKLSLFRQIQIGAGSLSLLGFISAFAWPPMIWLTAFVGAGLLFAGVTGFCGLGIVLQKMPWNKNN